MNDGVNDGVQGLGEVLYYRIFISDKGNGEKYGRLVEIDRR